MVNPKAKSLEDKKLNRSETIVSETTHGVISTTHRVKEMFGKIYPDALSQCKPINPKTFVASGIARDLNALPARDIQSVVPPTEDPELLVESYGRKDELSMMEHKTVSRSPRDTMCPIRVNLDGYVKVGSMPMIKISEYFTHHMNKLLGWCGSLLLMKCHCRGRVREPPTSFFARPNLTILPLNSSV